MENREYRFPYGPFDRRSRRITIAVIAVVTVALAAIVWLDAGSYLSAWSVSIVAAIVLLYILSIPRRITVDRSQIAIHCILELTTIPLKDLKTVRRISTRRMQYTLPLLGSYGFFGYYGYYFNLRRWETMKIYARRWSNFVEIESIYEEIYIVSCPDPDEFVKAVREMKRTSAETGGEDDRQTAP